MHIYMHVCIMMSNNPCLISGLQGIALHTQVIAFDRPIYDRDVKVHALDIQVISCMAVSCVQAERQTECHCHDIVIPKP